MPNSSKTGCERVADPIAGIIFTIIFLILLNLFYDDLGFITSGFKRVLPLYNLSLIVGIIIHASRLLFRSQLYKAATEFISLLLFVIIAYKLWVIFPFDPSAIGNQDTWNFILRLLIIVPPGLYALGAVVGLVKALRAD